MGKKRGFIYEYWVREISSRRLWLLWHNQKFREEYEQLLSKTRKIPPRTHPEWRTLQTWPDGNMFGQDDADWQAFYRKYELGKFWYGGEVLQRLGERPLGIEIVGENGSPEFIKLVFNPYEIKKTTISDLLNDIEEIYRVYFNEKREDPAWSLIYGNFWRDVIWYHLKWEGTHWEKIEKYEFSEIIEITKKVYPLEINRMFVEYLLRLEKKGAREPLFDLVDRERKIIKGDELKFNEKVNRLLYAFGIFLIGKTKVDWGDNIPYDLIFMSPVSRRGKISFDRFYIGYRTYQLNKNMFVVTQEEESIFLDKEKLREEFLDCQNQIYANEMGDSDCKNTIDSALNRLQEKIDQLI